MPFAICFGTFEYNLHNILSCLVWVAAYVFLLELSCFKIKSYFECWLNWQHFSLKSMFFIKFLLQFRITHTIFKIKMIFDFNIHWQHFLSFNFFCSQLFNFVLLLSCNISWKYFLRSIFIKFLITWFVNWQHLLKVIKISISKCFFFLQNWQDCVIKFIVPLMQLDLHLNYHLRARISTSATSSVAAQSRQLNSSISAAPADAIT